MKVKSSSVLDMLSRRRTYFQSGGSNRELESQAPFRSDLYNADQLRSHAQKIAASHPLKTKGVSDKLLKRLEENNQVLLEVRNLLVESVRNEQAITPAGEWLLDNFYLIEEQIVIARKHLPKGYSEGLPYLASGPSEGMPRVYDIVLEIISHSDGRVDVKSLQDYLASYQEIQPLKLGELWAVPIMLRLAVIENLRRVGEIIALDKIDSNLAEYWAERMMETVREDPANLVLTIADMARTNLVLNSPFVATYMRLLQGKGPTFSLPLNWLDQQLTRQGISSSDLIWHENQKQAADQVSVRNSIFTLRLIGATDWRDFVENLSYVEQLLRKDPNGVYPAMDFLTRDRYRHVIENIAKKSPLTEIEVTELTLKLAQQHMENEEIPKRKGLVGYFLVDKGRRTLERKAQMQLSLRQSITRFIDRRPVFLYLLNIVFFTLVGAGILFYVAYRPHQFSWPLLLAVALLSLLGSSQLAVSFVNWLSTIWVRPKLLPRMDFVSGIPEAYRTLITVPCMLSNKKEIENLLENLEVCYLANPENNLYFALVSDYVDAKVEETERDKKLLNQTIQGIAALNKKYNASPAVDKFYLFHRPRQWNSKENKWMGYERKRGKLSAVNQLLLYNKTDAFSVIEGRYEELHGIKYVLTLDADTILPREAAWKIIATMAHPLNHAVVDKQKNRVWDGYGILQPRVTSIFPKGDTSIYLRMQGDLKGIDPYTRASSDVYQDIFGEGSYIGKGIYDVQVFEEVLEGRFEENRILSHDLLEGCYVRSGLISDILLYEQNPSQYLADVKRHHRWIRGDWQIGAWIMPFVSDRNGKFVRNPLSALSKWKIFDNLRRSLIPFSLLLILLLGWFILPYPWLWTLAVTIIVLLPVAAAAILQLIRRPEDLDLRAHFYFVWASFRDILLNFVFGLSMLPYEAVRYTDAILKTNWRLLFSHKKLLEWTPSAAIIKNHKLSVFSNYRYMWIGPFIALVCILWFLQNNHPAFFVAIPILILWILSPALAWRVSLPEEEEEPDLSKEQVHFLNKMSRKTWAFFEDFVTEQENWLPPDNFQKHPDPVIAHRTSPTNIGMALLANLTAYDFGYISSNQLIERIENTLNTLGKMERYQGHFYNWYETRSLSTLTPRYISTVDSGNFIGALLTLKQGLLGLPQQPIFNPLTFRGIQTSVEVLKEESKGSKNPIIERMLQYLQEAIAENSSSLSIQKSHLDHLIDLSNELSFWEKDTETSLEKWSLKLQKQLGDARHELSVRVPWLDLLPVPGAFIHLQLLDYNQSISALVEMLPEVEDQVKEYSSIPHSAEEQKWLEDFKQALQKWNRTLPDYLNHLQSLADQCEEFSKVEYDFLFEPSTNLLRIGFNVDDQRKDESYYDMLASEARLAVFVAIAQGKITQESWFSLSRLLTASSAGPILLSWSGSMFEYLMPQLIMPVYENTLLDQTNLATVKRQIEYGKKQGVPWGISESGYNSVDANLNYQYRAFGVPGLGLKRGLGDDLVIAPYASMLALMVLPSKAATNLQIMHAKGYSGEYGFYEAIDFTPSRLPRANEEVIIYSYMTHHHGMSFLSMSYVLLGRPMQHRFITERRFQATLMLLQERAPKTSYFYAHTADISEIHPSSAAVNIRSVKTAFTTMPEVQLLSNGSYQIMVSNSGGGYSHWKNLSITRWREDSILDNYGIFCYIKEMDTGRFWSNTHHPTLQPASSYEATFSQGHVEFKRQDYGILTQTEIVVSPEDDAEMRKIRITNKTSNVKVLELTSYTEIVLATQASDEAHPAFSNLFVQTEIMKEHNAILATRRPRSDDEQPPHLFHLMDIRGAAVEEISYETDRMQFIGRGKTLVHPQSLDQPLTNSEGSVLDPIMAIRYRISIRPYQTATADLIFGISPSRESTLALMHKYRDKNLKKRAFELSWTHSQVLLRQIRATEADAQLYGRLVSSIIFLNPKFRPDSSILNSNTKGQPSLWAHSISGDLPIVLLKIFHPDSIEVVSRLVQAHAYWQLKGIAVDLVIWNEDHGSYRHELQDRIIGMVSSEAVSNLTKNQPGNIYVKSSDQLSTEDRVLFESIARVILDDTSGTLEEQVDRHFETRILPPPLNIKPVFPEDNLPKLAAPEGLLFPHEQGGFTPDGKEYKIWLAGKKTTPAPWVNIMGNSFFGTVVSESGSSYTWALNAHEYRISPWSNDPVSDQGGEAIYLRDEESGTFWSPSPFPVRGETPYLTTHGFGYSSFEHNEFGIESLMTVFIDIKWPIKFVTIKVKNLSLRSRKISVTGFWELILGTTRSKSNTHILSEYDSKNQALLFRNRYNPIFAERVACFKVLGSSLTSFTTDRAEFIGRNRNLTHPHALNRKKLSGNFDSRMDSCAALQARIDLEPGAEKEIIFLVGNESNLKAATALITQFSNPEKVAASLAQVKEYWKETLEAVQVQTPDTALNLLANGWLNYQTISSRLFARSGFYQSGGAFGFRDQLQDVLSLFHTRPNLAREQILDNASRQFVEGDVQHWWHPPEGRGVRTMCSDDYLWLPFVLTRYLKFTKDFSILEEKVGYLESRLLHEGEESFYDLPVTGNIKGSLYEHCVKALRHGMRFGAHGLPLMGAGDWNDGMDKVGYKGHGESVWLAFFLYDTLTAFVPVARQYGDKAFAASCEEVAAELKKNIELHAWDGNWYKRAWFDDGTPLGSNENQECKIDAISQSWAVLSGVASAERQQKAMHSLDTHLVNRDLKIIELLTPPFDSSEINPGYIKGYVPGVRENGGQYSHAAIWALLAFAKLGDTEKVQELYSMILPINHSLDEKAIQVYKVEPYVFAADVYANESHKGRGGWTWYTGSAGWVYHFITDALLGINREGNTLEFDPCLPKEWTEVTIKYRFEESLYEITLHQITNTGGEPYCIVDGKRHSGARFELINDGQVHKAAVFLLTLPPQPLLTN